MLARRLTDTAVIKTLTAGARSGGHNNPSQVWTAADPIPALSQTQSSTEALDSRDVVTSRRVLFLLPDAAVTFESRIVLGSAPGVDWRIVGDPAPHPALGGRPSHIEAVIERITD